MGCCCYDGQQESTLSAAHCNPFAQTASHVLDGLTTLAFPGLSWPFPGHVLAISWPFLAMSWPVLAMSRPGSQPWPQGQERQGRPGLTHEQTTEIGRHLEALCFRVCEAAHDEARACPARLSAPARRPEWRRQRGLPAWTRPPAPPPHAQQSCATRAA